MQRRYMQQHSLSTIQALTVMLARKLEELQSLVHEVSSETAS